MPKLTPDQLARIVSVNESTYVQKEVKKRGWTRDQFKLAFSERGFTFAEFERELGLNPSSVSQSLTRRFPKVDRLVSAFLDVPLHILWPNRYLRNGASIDYRYRAETMSDEELERLNSATRQTTVMLPQGVVIDD